MFGGSHITMYFCQCDNLSLSILSIPIFEDTMNRMMKLMMLVFSMLLCITCSKIELGNDDDDADDKPASPVSPSESDNSDDDGKGETQKCLSVAQFKQLQAEQKVWVEGYVVGYASGTSLKSAAFGTPESKEVRSNILLADSPGENNASNCMACQLVSGSEVREKLNLTDHPELLHRKVRLYGTVRKYYGTMGMKPVSACVILADEEKDDAGNNPGNTGGNAGTGSTEEGGNHPDNPNPSPDVPNPPSKDDEGGKGKPSEPQEPPKPQPVDSSDIGIGAYSVRVE